MGTRAFSLDLRQRAVDLFLSGEYTKKQIARLLKIGESTLKKYIRQYQETGDLNPLERKPRESAACNNPMVRDAVVALVQERNDATLQQYCDALDERCGIRISVPSMCILLQDLDLRFKKNRSRIRARHRDGAS